MYCNCINSIPRENYLAIGGKGERDGLLASGNQCVQDRESVWFLFEYTLEHSTVSIFFYSFTNVLSPGKVKE